MIKPTKNNLAKLEKIITSQNYVIRYEKGNFNSGNCIVNDKRMIILNKFFQTDARFLILTEIINQLDLDISSIPEEEQQFIHQILKAAQN